jgi:hypothetical protein
MKGAALPAALPTKPKANSRQYTKQEKSPPLSAIDFFLVHRKVEEVCTRPPPSKPIILREKWGFWGIFALFFNFARNLILADYLEPASTKSGRFEP